MSSVASIQMWIAFIVLVLVAMFVDLFLVNKKDHTPSLKESMTWCSVWIGLALLFNLGVGLYFGPKAGLEFLTGYIVELSLSVDNLFVFVLLFSAFSISKSFHHKILFWGILGAIIFRMIFILAGTALVTRFHWMFYIFGIFLIVSGIKIFLGKGEDAEDPKDNKIIKCLSKFLPLDPNPSHTFFCKHQGKLFVTPLFVTLLAIEISDVIFAVDSIPAIFAITKDPFIIFTSNIFAILGLRNFYFLLADLVDRFHYLNVGLGVVLTYIGLKMLLEDFYDVPVFMSLGFIFVVLGLSVFFSLRRHKKLHPEA